MRMCENEGLSAHMMMTLVHGRRELEDKEQWRQTRVLDDENPILHLYKR